MSSVDCRYPGMISRQALIDFCTEKASEAAHSAQECWKAANTAGMDPEAANVLLESYAADLATQKAYRQVCEWAAKSCAKTFAGEQENDE